jgi:hypothetical protein
MSGSFGYPERLQGTAIAYRALQDLLLRWRAGSHPFSVEIGVDSA